MSKPADPKRVFVPRSTLEDAIEGLTEIEEQEEQLPQTLETVRDVFELELEEQPDADLEERQVMALEQLAGSAAIQTHHLSRIESRLENIEKSAGGR